MVSGAQLCIWGNARAGRRGGGSQACELLLPSSFCRIHNSKWLQRHVCCVNEELSEQSRVAVHGDIDAAGTHSIVEEGEGQWERTAMQTQRAELVSRHIRTSEEISDLAKTASLLMEQPICLSSADVTPQGRAHAVQHEATTVSATRSN